MEPLPVLFWEIGSPDPEQAKDFYTKVCGWEFGDPDVLGYSAARGSKAGIPGGVFDAGEGAPFVMICVKVPDLTAAIRTAEEAGGSLRIPPTPVPELPSMFAVVEDPDGNRLGLYWEGDV